MVPISEENYVEIHCKNTPEENPLHLKKALKQAVKAKKDGATCPSCGQEIWALGSAVAFQGCFSCITGEADSSGDYEIDEVCWS